MDWLQTLIVDPYDHPQGWIGYLALPIVGSVLLAWFRPALSKTIVVAIVVPAAIVLYFGLYVALYGMSSTISIGVMFALAVFSCASAIASAATRWLRRRLVTSDA